MLASILIIYIQCFQSYDRLSTIRYIGYSKCSRDTVHQRRYNIVHDLRNTKLYGLRPSTTSRVNTFKDRFITSKPLADVRDNNTSSIRSATVEDPVTTAKTMSKLLSLNNTTYSYDVATSASLSFGLLTIVCMSSSRHLCLYYMQRHSIITLTFIRLSLLYHSIHRWHVVVLLVSGRSRSQQQLPNEEEAR